jgi:hypothetical protein
MDLEPSGGDLQEGSNGGKHFRQKSTIPAGAQPETHAEIVMIPS